MNQYEESRRAFLAKLGMTVGTTIAASTKLSATVLNSKAEFPLTADQQEFMELYENWMDKFIPAVKAQRENPDDKIAKAAIVDLSEEVETRRLQLIEFMKDDNFARYYMTATERLTKEIY
jgi:aldehyde:ferredoxin oxidoreductase